MEAPHPEFMNLKPRLFNEILCHFLTTDFTCLAPAGPPPRNHHSEASFIQSDLVSLPYYIF